MPFYRMPINASPSRYRGVPASLLSIDLDPDARSLIDRLSGRYSNDDLAAINNLIVGLKEDGLWSTIDVLYITAAPNSTDALLNWRQNAYNATIAGFPSFTADRGYSGWSTSSYLRTNFVPSIAGGNYSQNSSTIGLYNRVDVTTPVGGGIAMGATNPSSTASSRLELRDSNNQLTLLSTNSATNLPTISNNSATRLFLLSRTASNDSRLYRDGVQVGATATTASAANISVQFVVGCQNSGGSPSSSTNSSYQFSMIVIAGGWNSTQAANFTSRINTYLTYKGANV